VIQRIRQLISPTNPLRLAWHFLLEGFFALLTRFPGRELVIIGVTGTNGKTTTANLIAQILDEAGHPTALATTINFQIGQKKWENTTKKTTLGRGGLNRFLRRAVDAGCTHAVIEVSSHGLVQSRVLGVPFDAAVLTNVTPEHLDFHSDMAEYIEAKTRLFWNLAKSQKSGEKVAVLPAEDKNLAAFLRVPLEGVLTYGIKKGELTTKNLSVTNAGQKFTITGWEQDFEIETKLLGSFNVANILAATSVTLGIGVPVKKIQTAMRKMTPLPGRLELVKAGQPFRVVVDFAHTPDAVEKLLRTFRAVTSGKVWLVFGAAGDRTTEIRREMGRIAEKLADEIVITTDDPYDADPVEIIADVLSGAKRPQGKNLLTEIDRKKAIIYALKNARKGDTVLIAGKGNQAFQYWERGRKIAWDDRKIAKKILQSRGRKS
jgi:UDP-N-acetylmuramoyl-L-alanyl-D-glutamate--2,6-diaminopimelate ligase